MATLPVSDPSRALMLVPATRHQRAERTADQPPPLDVITVGRLTPRLTRSQSIPDPDAMMLMTRFTWYFPSLALIACDIAAP